MLSESLLFPYREGLSFEQDLWMDKGQNAAFAGALGPAPDVELGDYQPTRVRKKAYAGSAPAARHSSRGGQGL